MLRYYIQQRRQAAATTTVAHNIMYLSEINHAHAFVTLSYSWIPTVTQARANNIHSNTTLLYIVLLII